MKKLIIVSGIMSLGLALPSQAEAPYIPSHLEDGLVSICKSAALDNRLKMTKKMKEFHLKTKTVALNVMCNGQDIISFAERYGAEKTTAKLSNSIGSVSVTDIAAMNAVKYDVTFDFSPK